MAKPFPSSMIRKCAICYRIRDGTADLRPEQLFSEAAPASYTSRLPPAPWPDNRRTLIALRGATPRFKNPFKVRPTWQPLAAKGAGPAKWV